MSGILLTAQIYTIFLNGQNFASKVQFDGSLRCGYKGKYLFWC